VFAHHAVRGNIPAFIPAEAEASADGEAAAAAATVPVVALAEASAAAAKVKQFQSWMQARFDSFLAVLLKTLETSDSPLSLVCTCCQVRFFL
jgi:hypothetical protein